jgi:hypothetical protein
MSLAPSLSTENTKPFGSPQPITRARLSRWRIELRTRPSNGGARLRNTGATANPANTILHKPTCSVLAAIIQQATADVLLDRMRPIEPDCIETLYLDRPKAIVDSRP